MKKKTERQLEEAYNHIEPYLKDEKETEDLRKMCSNCEKYCGKEHDFEECKEMMCFKCYLALEYLDWCNGY